MELDQQRDMRVEFNEGNQNNDFFDPAAPFGPIELNILERVENGLNISFDNEEQGKNPVSPVNEKEMYQGHKEIIFVTGWININSVYQRYLFGFICKILVGLCIVWCLTSNNHNFAPVAFLLCLINAMHIIKNVYYLFAYRKSNYKVRFIFLIELHVSMAYFIYFLGFFLLLSHIITTRFFLLYSLPYILLTVILFFKNADNNMYLSQKKFSIFESFQLFLIAVKFSQIGFVDWNYTLIFFMAAAIYFTVLGLLLTIILSCSLFGFLYRNLESWKIKSLIWMTWYYLWSGMIYIYIIKGVIHFYNEDNIYQHEVISDYTAYRSDNCEVLLVSGVLMITFSFVNLVFHLIWKKEIKKYLTKVIYKDELRKEISLRFFTESFTFKLIQVSSTYFTRPDKMNENQREMTRSCIKVETEVEDDAIEVKEIEKKEVLSDLENDLCVICYQDVPNIAVDPCGHGGVCKTCMIHYIKTDDIKCPFCKGRIENIYLLEYKENENEFYAKGEIKFKY